MEARLHAAGIHTVASLCQTEKAVLRGVWGGVLGDRLWHLLQGEVIPDLVSSRKSIGHSHVLPPDSRQPGQAWPVLCKLLHKACERLRFHGMLAGSLAMKIAFFRDVSWSPEIRFQETDSTLVLMKLIDQLWRDRPDPKAPIIQVGVVLTRLVESSNHTPDLFANHVGNLMALQDDRQKRLDASLDQLRARYGRDVVYFGGVQDSRDKAPMRISFTHIPDLAVESDHRP